MKHKCLIINFIWIFFWMSAFGSLVAQGIPSTISKKKESPNADTTHLLHGITILEERTHNGMSHLPAVHEGAIYAGKKNEVIVIDSVNANVAQNISRQVLGRVPGIMISETEGSGFPANGIGLRGLIPTQSLEMNTRQNGYNIAADLFGYAEAYYLPPLEGVERIEIIRGAASLQFGPQFGGVVNYITRRAPNKPFEFTSQQTIGSFGVYNAYNSIGGTVGRFSYFAFVQYTGVQGWRPNSDMQRLTGFGSIGYKISEKLQVGIEYSLLRNTVHMPGGFTDAQFNSNSQASYRARNWLNSPWNVASVSLEYTPSSATKLFVKSTYLNSNRNLIWRDEDGGPGTPDSISPVTNAYVPRELQKQAFISFTTEARLIHNYKLGAQISTLSVGARHYSGNLKRQGGGQGSTGSDFDLTLYSNAFAYDLNFTTQNVALFAENLFQITDAWSITPGFRYEYILSTASGYKVDGDAGVVVQSDLSRTRNLFLGGVGTQYQITSGTQLYANISQAYRPMDYSALTPLGVTSKIDPNLKDASGYNADLGWRGNWRGALSFDVGLFYMAYNNRVGIVLLTDESNNPYTYRTNIANSVHQGIETYVEVNLGKILHSESKWGAVSVFNAFSLIDARYTTGAYKGNRVEYAPNFTQRLGISYSYKGFMTTAQWNITGMSYGDANNTVRSEDATVGEIPSYEVVDWSTKIKWQNFNIGFGINNVLDKKYFTLRADEYPGPGIIPGIGRSFYATFGIRI